MDENEFKCPNCGASLAKEEKKCSYCGSTNKYYEIKKLEKLKSQDLSKDNETDEEEEFDKDFGDIFGGFLGGVALSKVFKDITKSILPHKKR